MKSYEEILVDIENMSDDEVVNIWNEYCDEAGDSDEHIYEMDEFDTENVPPRDWDDFWERKEELEDFDPNDGYWYREGGFDLRSIDEPWAIIREEDIAQAIVNEEFEPSWDFGEDEGDDEEEPQEKPQEKPQMTGDEISELAKRLFAMEG